MMPQSRNSPLLANGSLTYVSSAMDKKQTRGTVRRSDLYSALPEVIKELVQSLFGWKPSFESSGSVQESSVILHSAFVREFSVQLWSVNRRTTEAEEVTES
jgi:hypothetical protein